jgi:hypothetical protein
VVAFWFTPDVPYTGIGFSTLVTHELGHKLNFQYGVASIVTQEMLNNETVILKGRLAEEGGLWRHTSDPGDESEMFADMFTAWVFNAWNESSITTEQDIINGAIKAMTTAMSKITR